MSGARELTIVDDRIDTPLGTELVMELLVDLAERYGGPDPDEPSPSDLAPPAGCFLVARLDGLAAGCGGVRALADDADLELVAPDTVRTGEIKRMYTRPTARRRGVGRALLGALEDRARALGYGRLVLETGTKQPEAIALYEAFGYELIPSYGQYKDYDDSRCFAKQLAASDASARIEQHRE